MLAAMPSISGAAVTSAFTPPARDRGRADACPGALRPHLADDGALFRVRLPGGLVTARQAGELAAVAEESGDGHLDLTSRGNVQLRGLPADAGAALAQRLLDAGLLPSARHERARNAVASPLCGVDGGHADVQYWTRELDRLLCASDRAAELSGRFLFALDDGRGDVAALGADVTLVARPDGTAALRLGPPGSPAWAVAGADGPRLALLAAEEFAAFTAGRGERAWRVADLGADADALRARLAGALARRSPTGEVPPTMAELTYESGGEPAGPPPLGVLGDGPVRALSVLAPLGRLSAAAWRTAAGLAARAGDGGLRVTPWRGLVLPAVAADRAAPALERLERAGFVTRSDSAWHRASACTGRPGCARSLADVRADAAEALAADPAGSGRPVHWSGCARRCGRPAGEDWIDVLALGNGYRVTRDGTARDVTRQQAPGAVAAARHTTSARNT